MYMYMYMYYLYRIFLLTLKRWHDKELLGSQNQLLNEALLALYHAAYLCNKGNNEGKRRKEG